jgi:hydroxymethylglutaryl-CoA synthase
MRGLLSVAGFVPHHRLQRGDIRGVLGKGGGKGTRSVASYDEDTTTMAVEAGRLALKGAPDATVDRLWFATSVPAYLDKTNATTVHAALRLDSGVLAMDAGGAIRSGIGALRSALESEGTTLVVSADLRSGRPSSAEEVSGGDGAAAVLVGEGEVIAEYLGGASVTDEFVERWKAPGDRHTRSWEDRFGESVYPDLGRQAWEAALKAASLEADAVTKVVVHSQNARAAGRLAKALGGVQIIDDLGATVGNSATAHAGLLLAAMVDQAEPGEVLALVSLVDGADVLLFRVTGAVTGAAVRPVADQVAAAADLPYATFLAWRGEITLEPPNRPEPARPSSAVAHRTEDWKFGFEGSRDRESGALHLPPARVSFTNANQDDMDPAPMADVEATVATFTVDRMAYSPSPPTIFAILDFDGGGRFPCELTDCDEDEVAIGDRTEMTFRVLGTQDGIHNYFWKARLLPKGG